MTSALPNNYLPRSMNLYMLKTESDWQSAYKHGVSASEDENINMYHEWMDMIWHNSSWHVSFTNDCVSVTALLPEADSNKLRKSNKYVNIMFRKKKVYVFFFEVDVYLGTAGVLKWLP